MNNKLGIIGLGYVGLPLAVEFGKVYQTIGFDIDNKRINDLNNYHDKTLEIESHELENVINKEKLTLTNEISKLSDCNVYIITVPTPIDKNNKPDLIPIISATKLLIGILKKGDYIIYESTVYPGLTEEICVPIIEENCNFKLNIDFFVGYSPERINPGDKKRTLTKIVKITSGSNYDASIFVDNLYKKIITAGTYLASSIKVAEAAKVIENAQRDINIAFVNELSMIFNKLNIDTTEVLEAASTKWNFINFRPGLVGGHCIGVDPYYLAQKAQEVGHNPEIILGGRRINDNMANFIVTDLIKELILNKVKIYDSKILILGITFKENCPDIRNSKVIDIHNELIKYGIEVDVFDNWASEEDVKKYYSIKLIKDKKKIINKNYSAIIIAVAHDEFKSINLFRNNNCFVYDLKSVLDKKDSNKRL